MKILGTHQIWWKWMSQNIRATLGGNCTDEEKEPLTNTYWTTRWPGWKLNQNVPKHKAMQHRWRKRATLTNYKDVSRWPGSRTPARFLRRTEPWWRWKVRLEVDLIFINRYKIHDTSYKLEHWKVRLGRWSWASCNPQTLATTGWTLQSRIVIQSHAFIIKILECDKNHD